MASVVVIDTSLSLPPDPKCIGLHTNAVNEISERYQIMRNPLFWTRLAYTSCGLLRESANKSLRRLWIDDFLPESATDTKHGVDFDGIAWVGDGSGAMHGYRFVVSVPQRMLHRRQDEFSIERFDLDEERQTLQLEIRHENVRS